MNLSFVARIGRLTVFCAAALLLALSGAGGQSLASIVVGCTPVDDSTAVLYAESAGLFRRAGLNVKIERTASGAAAAAAVLGGSLQFAASNTMSLISAHARGVPLRIAAPGQVYIGQEFMSAVVKKGSPIKHGRDLGGAVVGTVSVSDLNMTSFQAWVDQHGGDARSLRSVELPYTAMVAALEDGRLDVALLLGPVLQDALASGTVTRLANPLDAVGKRFVSTVWLMSASYGADNPDVVRRFAGVVHEAAIYANAHRAATAPIFAAFTGMDAQQVLRSGRAIFDEAPIEASDLQPVIDIAGKYKAIDKVFDARELINATR